MIKLYRFVSFLILFAIITGCTPARYPSTSYQPLRFESASSDPLSPGIVDNLQKIDPDHVNASTQQIEYKQLPVDKPLLFDGKDARKFRRMMTYSANLSLETHNKSNFPVIIGKIDTLAMELEGYTENLSQNHISIKVPAQNLAKAIEKISAFGEIVDKNVYGEDVGGRYFDLSIKLDNLEKTRTRYLELLNKADKVENILSIEKELERLLLETEFIKGQLQRMEHSERFSTIIVNLRESVTPGPVGWVFYGLYHAVVWLFVW